MADNFILEESDFYDEGGVGSSVFKLNRTQILSSIQTKIGDRALGDLGTWDDCKILLVDEGLESFFLF